MNTVACCALDGWVVRVSILLTQSFGMVGLKGSRFECGEDTCQDMAILEWEDRWLGVELRRERMIG